MYILFFRSLLVELCILCLLRFVCCGVGVAVDMDGGSGGGMEVYRIDNLHFLHAFIPSFLLLV